MRGLLWLLAAFALAAGVSVGLRGSEGYVLAYVPPWRIELSLILSVLLLLLAFLLMHGLLRAISHVLALPAEVRAFRQRNADRRAAIALADALEALHAGRFARAERLAREALQVGVQHPAPMLLAARAAQRMKAYERRDTWLERIGSEFPKSRDAMLTLKAECLIDQRQFDAARSVLHGLHAGGPRHIASLQLLLRAEQGCGNWAEVVRLARLLEKRDALASEAAAGVVVAARLSQLTAQAGDLQRLQLTWRSMDEQERRHPRLVAVVARAFASHADELAARRVLELALEAEWDAELVLLYGQTVAAEALPRIEQAEAWLLRRPQDAELLLTLGRLCLLQSLWGKAQRYLEASDALSSEVGSEDFSAALALAQLFEQQGRADAARQYYRRAALGLREKS